MSAKVMAEAESGIIYICWPGGVQGSRWSGMVDGAERQDVCLRSYLHVASGRCRLLWSPMGTSDWGGVFGGDMVPRIDCGPGNGEGVQKKVKAWLDSPAAGF